MDGDRSVAGSWTRVRLRRSGVATGGGCCERVRRCAARCAGPACGDAGGARWVRSARRRSPVAGVRWRRGRRRGGVPGVAVHGGRRRAVGSGAGGSGRVSGGGEGGGVGGAGAGDGCAALFAGGGGAAGRGPVGGVGGGVGAAGVAEPGGPVRGVGAGFGARDAATMAALSAGRCSERVAVAVVQATATLSVADRAVVDARVGPLLGRLGVSRPVRPRRGSRPSWTPPRWWPGWRRRSRAAG